MMFIEFIQLFKIIIIIIIVLKHNIGAEYNFNYQSKKFTIFIQFKKSTVNKKKKVK